MSRFLDWLLGNAYAEEWVECLCEMCGMPYLLHRHALADLDGMLYYCDKCVCDIFKRLGIQEPQIPETE